MIHYRKEQQNEERTSAMDEHLNGNHSQNQDDQWNRWNSSAANSSYHNQHTHRPYDEAFSIASLVLGLLSVTLGCCGISIPLGALGILFAMLCYRKGKRMNSNARFGLCLSAFGLIYGIALILYSLFIQLPAQLQDPAYMNQLNQMYQTFFGMDFQEFMQSFYGIDL